MTQPGHGFLFLDMSYLNVEIKARLHQPAAMRQWLSEQQASFHGTQQQTDTYFRVLTGRLKLREEKPTSHLIYYQRENVAGPRPSAFHLVPVPDPAAMKRLLQDAFGTWVVVQKLREVYTLENVRFHIDEVPSLGIFMEIEAGNVLAEKETGELWEQCHSYMAALGIQPEDLVAQSYSDLLIAGSGSANDDATNSF